MIHGKIYRKMTKTHDRTADNGYNDNRKTRNIEKMEDFHGTAAVYIR